MVIIGFGMGWIGVVDVVGARLIIAELSPAKLTPTPQANSFGDAAAELATKKLWVSTLSCPEES